jgi:hypothetical protein
VLADAWKNVRFSSDPMPAALQKQLEDGRALGYVRSDGNLTGFLDGTFLGGVEGVP